MTSPPQSPVSLRAITADDHDAIAWVALRMRHTLMEVLGDGQGGQMYTIEWLIERVRSHLIPQQIVGEVVVAELNQQVVGHTIVRVDNDGEGHRIGLFSTTWVEPHARNQNVAAQLLDWGERWMVNQGLSDAVTYTDKDNHKLQQLYQKRGYQMTDMPNDFVKLFKAL